MPEALPNAGTAIPTGVAEPGLWAMAYGFFGIGIVGFGGVLPWARRMIVDQRKWLNAAEFNDLLALCQFLPGPNICNVAMALGTRFHGLAGGIVCLAGLLAAPMVIVIMLGGVYARYGAEPVVAHAFMGLAAAASGLMVSMAIKIAAPLRWHWVGIGIALLAFAAIAVLRLPLLPTMIVLAPLSVLICKRWPA